MSVVGRPPTSNAGCMLTGSTNKFITKSGAASNVSASMRLSKVPSVLGQPTIHLFTRLLPVIVNNSHILYHTYWQIPLLLSFIEMLLPSEIQLPPNKVEVPRVFILINNTYELLPDFTPIIPAEVSQLVESMLNKSSKLDYIPISQCWNHDQTLSPSSFYIWQSYLPPKPLSRRNSNWHSSQYFCKNKDTFWLPYLIVVANIKFSNFIWSGNPTASHNS